MDNEIKTMVTRVIRDNSEDKTNLLSPEDASTSLLKELSMKPRDRYKFIRTIGIGGMKAVLLVHDNDTNRNVALAMMPDFKERSAEDVAKFVNEAKITASLEHPFIVPIHDIGLDSNMAPYFVMTYLPGLILSTLLMRMRNNDTELLAFYHERKMLYSFQRICHAVEFAHSQNILHLDLKPANIHIGKFGEVQVLDWGLARYIEKGQKKSSNAKKNILVNTAGTPGYMAPEQAIGDESLYDERTDVYSLGAILFAILTFRSPALFWEGENIDSLLKRTANGSIIRDVEIKNEIRDVPPELASICRKAMALRKIDRYQSVKELRDDIGKYLANFPTLAEAPAAHKKVFLFVKRNIAKIAVAGAFALLLAAAAVLYYLFQRGILILNY
ncbi:MAG: serine/threonine protein kinase [Lentisphaeria bacterium]|nr:serine/threonine protein kinase [Lentisphaeria bacterium]